MAAARTKAYPGSAAYRFQLRHSGLYPVMVAHVKFAIMVVSLLAIVVGSYWFVMVPPGRERQERETER